MIQQLSDVLKSLKWREYEIDVYSALVEKGPMSAQSLTYETDVPSGRVYDVLNSLQSRGAVVTSGLKPRMFDAQNPRAVLMTALSSLEASIDKALASAEQAYEKRSSETTESDPKSWIVNGTPGISTQIRWLMSRTSSSFYVCDQDISWLGRRDFNSLKKMARERKELRILSSRRFIEDLEDLETEGIEARIGASSISVYISDKSMILIKLSTSPPQGIFMIDSPIVESFLTEFQMDFKKAKSIKVTEVAN